MYQINKKLRLEIAEMVYRAGEGHIPSAFSIVEILNVLYSRFLKLDKDHFILSKGHGCAALYVLLEKYGFITKQDLERKSRFGGILGGHPDSTKVPGIEASTGSLGHGIAMGLGMALGVRIRKIRGRVVVLIGDGECNEGAVWETALVSANLKLGNLCVIVDENGSADQILPVMPLSSKWQSFGWETYDVNGHDEQELLSVLQKLRFNFSGKPKVIIAHTVKGRGVSFLEGHGIWHSKVPNDEEIELIRRELQ